MAAALTPLTPQQIKGLGRTPGYADPWNMATAPSPASPAFSGIPAGTNYGAYPGEAPDYTQGYRHGMELAPGIQHQLDDMQLNTGGLEQYRREATRSGPSAWAALSMQKNRAEESAMRQKLGREAAGQTAEGESALAMRGGLTGGARERLRSGATKDMLDMSQNVGRQRGLNDLQIGTQDEQNRISQLGALPGMEVESMQPGFEKLRMSGQAQQMDQQNYINEAIRKNQYNQDIWGKKMEAWGANRTAQATENAGKK